MVVHSGKQVLTRVHRPHEIEAYKSTEDAKKNAGRRAFQRPTVVEVEGEKAVVAGKDIGEARCRDTRNEDGEQGGHREVDHQHFEREYESGYRRLENAGDGRRRTAAHKPDELAVVHAEQLAQVGTDGTARQDYRRFGTDRSAAADGNARRDDARPAVVPLQLGLLGRYGVEYAGDSV